MIPNKVEGKAARKKNDFYPTSVRFVESALSRLVEDEHVDFSFVLDPGAGRGSWGQALYTTGNSMHTFLTGVDLTPYPDDLNDLYDCWHQGDFLFWQPPIKYTLIVGNPPYAKLAEKFIRKSMPLLDEGGHLMFLLKGSFWLGSRGRAEGLFREFPPKRIYKCFPRPFSGHAEDYVLILWQEGYQGQTETAVLVWQ